MINFIKNSVFILIGIASAAFGLKGFLLPNHIIDGGITGLSMLVAHVSGASLWWIILLINAPFVLLALKVLSMRFALITCISIALLSASLKFVELHAMTSDKLLAAIFGGILLGCGIGFTTRGGGVLDGTEAVSIILSRRLQMTIGDIILLLNLMIFLTAFSLMPFESVLYSILTYFAASRMVDFIVYGIDERIEVTIISKHSDAIREGLLYKLQKGVTVLQGRTGIKNEQQDVIICVATRFEIPGIKRLVTGIDGRAFIIFNKISDTSGGKIEMKSAF